VNAGPRLLHELRPHLHVISEAASRTAFVPHFKMNFLRGVEYPRCEPTFVVAVTVDDVGFVFDDLNAGISFDGQVAVFFESRFKRSMPMLRRLLTVVNRFGELDRLEYVFLLVRFCACTTLCSWFNWSSKTDF